MEDIRKFDLQFFAEEGEQPQDQGNQNDGDEAGKQDKDKKAEKLFTQEELDEILAKRLERERKKYKDVEEKLKRLEQLEKEAEERRLKELSEQERLQELLKKAEEEKSTLAKQLEELQNAVKHERIVNEFVKLAHKYNIAYVDDALKLADLSSVTVDEDGVHGVEDVIKKLVEEKPFLLAQQPKEPKTIGGPSNPKPATDKTKEQLLREAAEKARKSGRIEDRVAYAKLKRELGI